MNNTGIEDEVIEAWVGQRNGMIEKIKTKMREIINEDSPITKIKMTTEEANFSPPCTTRCPMASISDKSPMTP